MLYREIIVTDGDAVLDSVVVIASSENALIIKLEEVFLQMCRDYDDGFDDNEYTDSDIGGFLEDSVYEFNRGMVTIRNPSVIDADAE